MPIIGWTHYRPENFKRGNVVRLWVDYGADTVSLRQGEVIDSRNTPGKLTMRVDLVGLATFLGNGYGIIDEYSLGLVWYNRRVSRLPYTGNFSHDKVLVAEKRFGKGWRVI